MPAAKPSENVEEVELQGHIIDSLLLPKVLDEILTRGGTYVIKDIQHRPAAGRSELRPPRGPRRHAAQLDEILDAIHDHGAVPIDAARLRPSSRPTWTAPFPNGFYSTTNYRTQVRLGGEWIDVEDQEMDCGIVVDARRSAARCVPMTDVRSGDPHRRRPAGAARLARRDGGPAEPVRVHGQPGLERKAQGRHRPRDRRRHEAHASAAGEKILAVLGPAVVHTGSVEHICELIRGGYLDVLFAGNALATHDIEQALYGTSLGVSLDRGLPAEEGHEHHLRAINTIRRLGGIAAAVDQGVLKSGIMYECVTHNVPFVLAGSIRDDGPLPEVITDVLVAQDAMREQIQGVGFCLMMATMLHSIATGNLLPAVGQGGLRRHQPGHGDRSSPIAAASRPSASSPTRSRSCGRWCRN